MIYKLGDLFGVSVVETPVGFKYIGPTMTKENALMGGEESGGFGFCDVIFGWDSSDNLYGFSNSKTNKQFSPNITTKSLKSKIENFKQSAIEFQAV